MKAEHSIRQTTVVIAGKNGVDQAAVLCSLLGDQSNPRSANHVLRVVTAPSERSFFLDTKTGCSVNWRFHEQNSAWSSMNSWKTHVGSPDTVLSIDDLDSAITGRGTLDDGSIADAVILCCGLEERLALMQYVARVLYRLDAQDTLLSSQKHPLLLGTLGPARLSDWVARIVFENEKPSNFYRWKRPLAFFGLERYPFICHIVKTGVGVFFAGQQQIVASVCPSLPIVRRRTIHILGTILKQRVEFEKTIKMEENRNLMDSDDSLFIEDLADPHASLSFLSKSLYDPLPIVDSCRLYAILEELDSSCHLTDLSAVPVEQIRKVNPGIMVVAMAKEWQALIDILDVMLSPIGYRAISSSHDGNVLSSIIGTCASIITRNTSECSVSQSNALSVKAFFDHQLERKIHFGRLVEHLVANKLLNDPHLSSTLFSPFHIKGESNHIFSSGALKLLSDGVPRGICIALGLGELVGLDVKEHMPNTVRVVCRLQKVTGKEYISPEGCAGVVANARDVGETLCPQAFGIRTLKNLKEFLRLSPIASSVVMEKAVAQSPIGSRSKLSRF